ncbi:MAG TPA: helix-turn-helix transcriptional regulator [Anaerolineae bacterium]|nr:helix-turn-helix transcriptional regulator [Anaerolineae bacterium]
MKGYKRVADLMKALAHPIRLQILEVLETEAEACVCHLEARLGQRQAYISQQLAKLREAGLVVDRRDGLNIFYALAQPDIEPLLGEAKRMAVALARTSGFELVFAPIREVSPDQCHCPKCEQKVAV